MIGNFRNKRYLKRSELANQVVNDEYDERNNSDCRVDARGQRGEYVVQCFVLNYV